MRSGRLQPGRGVLTLTRRGQPPDVPGVAPRPERDAVSCDEPASGWHPAGAPGAPRGPWGETNSGGEPLGLRPGQVPWAISTTSVIRLSEQPPPSFFPS